MPRKKKLGQEPAFPLSLTSVNLSTYDNYDHRAGTAGMSKRFYVACEAMRGILSNTNYRELVATLEPGNQSISIVAVSYKFADELLKQE